MQEPQGEFTGCDVSPDKFHFISWLLCMSGILIPAMAVSMLDDRDDALPGYFFGTVVLLLYLAIPYTIYHNQVVNGAMTGCFAQLVFLLFTGVIGAVIVLWYWDLIRWLQKLIMRPHFEVRYSVNSKGMLRG